MCSKCLQIDMFMMCSGLKHIEAAEILYIIIIITVIFHIMLLIID